MGVKNAKSLQTSFADQTIWSTMLFSMMSFTAVYYTTNLKFQHIRAEYATVLLENKAESGVTKTLFVCVFFFLFFFNELLFSLSRTPYAIESMPR